MSKTLWPHRVGIRTNRFEIVLYGLTVADTRDPDFRSEYQALHPNRVVHWDTARQLDVEWVRSVPIRKGVVIG